MASMGLLGPKSLASIVMTGDVCPIFLNAQWVGYSKETIEIPIKLNLSHCKAQQLLEIMPIIPYILIVGPHICPISALYFQHSSPISSPIF